MVTDSSRPHPAHHFDSLEQQFDAAKLGMWLFLATEFLLFGGLFCLYAVMRSRQPELFSYGSQFLDTKWGAINTVVLIMSSLTMAWAVRCAQLGQRKRLAMCLALTVLGGAGFMGIKYIEYSHKFHENLVWGVTFYDDPAHAQPPASESFEAAESIQLALANADAVRGRTLWIDSCRACHGIRGEGIPGQGKSFRGSAFIPAQSDEGLIAFIKIGRPAAHPLNSTGIAMPSKGGNPLLTDQDLADIVAHLRTFSISLSLDSPEPVMLTESATGVGGALPRSTIPEANRAPGGLISEFFPGHAAREEAAASQRTHGRHAPDRPANLHLFFGIYFLMTGLHGVHVLVGMALISWLMVRAMRGRFGPSNFTAVDLTGLYWHVVDVIWIFLFPLLYLIH